MNDCIFCKIIKNDIESSTVFENDYVLAFMDLNPINKGHVLIIPKKHSQRFTQIDESDVAEMFKAGSKILQAIEKSSIACEGANIFLSDGEVAGQEVFHSHLHIAPRFIGDGHRMGFSHSNPTESSRDKLNETASEIANYI